MNKTAVYALYIRPCLWLPSFYGSIYPEENCFCPQALKLPIKSWLSKSMYSTTTTCWWKSKNSQMLEMHTKREFWWGRGELFRRMWIKRMGCCDLIKSQALDPLLISLLHSHFTTQPCFLLWVEVHWEDTLPCFLHNVLNSIFWKDGVYKSNVFVISRLISVK